MDIFFWSKSANNARQNVRKHKNLTNLCVLKKTCPNTKVGCKKDMGGQYFYACTKMTTPAPTLLPPSDPSKIKCPQWKDIPRPPFFTGESYKKVICDMLRIINTARKNWKPSLKPYCLNSKLMRAASVQSYASQKCKMMKHNLWKHGCKSYYPAYGSHADRMKRCGFLWRSAAEIMAGGTAQQAYNMWLSEYTKSGKLNNHYGFIVNPTTERQIGIGAAGGVWTIVGAKPRKNVIENCDMRNWCSSMFGPFTNFFILSCFSLFQIQKLKYQKNLDHHQKNQKDKSVSMIFMLKNNKHLHLEQMHQYHKWTKLFLCSYGK